MWLERVQDEEGGLYWGAFDAPPGSAGPDRNTHVKAWYWLPLPLIRVSCLLHGLGWLRVGRDK